MRGSTSSGYIYASVFVSKDGAHHVSTVGGRQVQKILAQAEDIELNRWYRLLVVVKGVSSTGKCNVKLIPFGEASSFEIKDVDFRQYGTIEQSPATLLIYGRSRQASNAGDSGIVHIDNYIAKELDFGSGSEFACDNQSILADGNSKTHITLKVKDDLYGYTEENLSVTITTTNGYFEESGENSYTTTTDENGIVVFNLIRAAGSLAEVTAKITTPWGTEQVAKCEIGEN